MIRSVRSTMIVLSAAASSSSGPLFFSGPRALDRRIHAIITSPKPGVITRDYAGPMRSRKKPRISRRPKPAAITASAQRKARPNPAFEDGILA